MISTISRTLSTLLFLCLLGLRPAVASDTTAAKETPPQTLDELKTAVEKIRQDTHTPAVGVAIVNKDGPLWVAGLGVANIEQNTKADENTMFRIASASKMFVGLSILKLVEDGKLNLSDKLHDVAPEIQFENPWEATHPVLITHLLEHSTGWDSRLSEYANEAPDSMRLQEGLSDPHRVKARTSRWMPGTRHAYSNTGPVVAAYVVEKVTQKSYEDFVQETFFNPLEMDSSTFYKTPDYLKRAAALYVGKSSQEYAQVYSRPSSSVNTSASDMAKLLQFFLQQGSFNNVAILTPASITKMQTPVSTLGAQQGLSAGYGLTMELRSHKNFATYGHNGGLPGAITEFTYIPELQIGFVLMLNASNGEAYERLSDTISDFLVQDNEKLLPKAIALPEKFRNLDGYYSPTNPASDLLRIVSDLTDTITISHDGSRLFRASVFGDWQREDYASNNNYLISSKSGLPSLAIVQDPLLGETIQVGNASYRRVSALVVYGRLALLAGITLFSLTSLLFALVWITRWLRGSLTNRASIRLRVWPLLTTVTLVLVPVAPMVFGNDIADLARISATSVSLFILSLAYPLLALYSLFVIYQSRALAIGKWLFLHACAQTLLHVLLATCLASYGLLGLKLWA